MMPKSDNDTVMTAVFDVRMVDAWLCDSSSARSIDALQAFRKVTQALFKAQKVGGSVIFMSESGRE